MKIGRLLLALAICLAPSIVAAQVPNLADGHWVDTWAATPQLAGTADLPPAPFTESSVMFQDTTLRQTLHLSLGASTIRLRFTNVFGTTTLPITAVTVALPTNGSTGVSSIQLDTLQNVTFSGSSSFTIPNGSLVVSDPISLKVDPQSAISVSMYFESGQQGMNVTSHPLSMTTSFFANGNAIWRMDLANATSVDHWYFVSAVEAWAPKEAVSFVVVGASIVDGMGSDLNMNDRWPNQLFSLMQNNTNTSHIAVIDQGLSGNRVLTDGVGPNAFGRIDRDVLAHSATKYAMIFEGVNDIGNAPTDAESQMILGEQMILGYQQIISHIHALGIPMFGATITPCGNFAPYANPIREQTRQRVNDWIRTSGKFDAVFDFDAVVRDPKNATVIVAEFDSGDGLHPNAAGYRAIAESVPLEIFDHFAEGVSGFM